MKVEPAGRWYEALCQRRRQRHSVSHHSVDSSSSEESEEEIEIDQNDEALLLGLDPKEWKVKRFKYTMLNTFCIKMLKNPCRKL